METVQSGESLRRSELRFAQSFALLVIERKEDGSSLARWLSHTVAMSLGTVVQTSFNIR